jgi:hypothetical protein
MLLAGACRQIIGIEEAEVDPALAASSQGAGAGAAQALTAGQMSANTGPSGAGGLGSTDQLGGSAGSDANVSGAGADAGAGSMGGAATGVGAPHEPAGACAEAEGGSWCR